MKKLARRFLSWYLRILSRLALLIHRPLVMAVSGSTRKTETKEALYEKLAGDFPVRRNPRSYNTEIGVPLSILGVPAGDSSYAKWFWRLIQAKLSLFKHFPRVLILEFGVARRGDMAELLRIARPQIALFTTIEAESADGGESAAVARDEQAVLVRALPKDGLALLNKRDPLVASLEPEAPCPVAFYGTAGGRTAQIAAAVKAAEAAVRQKLQNS